MNKIIIAFDGAEFSDGAFQFACHLNKVKPILLAGVFLPLLDYADLWSKAGGGLAGPVYVPLLDDEEINFIKKNIERFTQACKANNIECMVHKDVYDFSLPELKKEPGMRIF